MFVWVTVDEALLVLQGWKADNRWLEVVVCTSKRKAEVSFTGRIDSLSPDSISVKGANINLDISLKRATFSFDVSDRYPDSVKKQIADAGADFESLVSIELSDRSFIGLILPK